MFSSCAKTDEFESQDFNMNNTTNINGTLKHLSNEYKQPDLDAGPNDPACVDGSSYCSEFCCVEAPLLSDYMDAIDNAKESDFLSDSDVLGELSLGSKYYSNILKDVRDGLKGVIYYEYPRQSRFLFLYGDSSLSYSNYEAAQVLNF